MTTQEFISKYKWYAIWEHIRTGIPASVTLAQGILESNSGNSFLASKNNFFGIKAYSNPDNLPVVYVSDDRPNEPFRAYDTPYQGFKDHSKFLLTNPRYLETLQTKNYIDFAKLLQQAGYATAQNYATTLVSVIETNSLSQYDFYGKYKYALSAIILLIISSIIFAIVKYGK